MIESGTLYSASILAVLITYLAASRGYQCVFDALPSLIVSTVRTGSLDLQ